MEKMNTKRYIYHDGKIIEKTKSDDSRTVSSKNPIVRWFSRKKMDIALKMARLKKEDIILDFGCGGGYLKRSNPKFNITGYDINPEQTEIDDYTKIHPTKIFVLDVFEHLPEKEIKGILNNFKKMSSNFDLITAIPTENLISRKARKLLGKTERVSDHITPLKEILKILNKEFKLREKRNFITVTYIARYSYTKA